MALFKRNETYYVDITIPGGSRTRESTGTGDRKAAQEFHDALKARLWKDVKLGQQEQVERTWDEAALRWLREKAGKKDFELLAYGGYIGNLLGSETGYMLGSSAPPGTPAQIRGRQRLPRGAGSGSIVRGIRCLPCRRT